jgi:hypothetical protein
MTSKVRRALELVRFTLAVITAVGSRALTGHTNIINISAIVVMPLDCILFITTMMAREGDSSRILAAGISF